MPASLLVTAVVAALLGVPASASADRQTRAQVECITTLHGGGARVAKAALRNLVQCVSQGVRGELPAGQSADACVAADNRGRVARARARTFALASRRCTEPPDFGAASAAEVTAAFESLANGSGVFGPSLDDALGTADGDRPTGRCQMLIARRMLRTVRERLRVFNACSRTRLRAGTATDEIVLAECYGGQSARFARFAERFAARIADTCSDTDIATAFPGACVAESASTLASCVDRIADCDSCLAVNSADGISALRPHGFENGVAVAYCGARPVTDQSVARQWDEEILDAIRIDFPRPPIHARNLFHLSAAMWDAWAAYDSTSDGYLVTEKHTPADVQADRDTAISFAAYRVLASRYAGSPNANTSRLHFRRRMNLLGYDPGFTSTVGSSPAALGNRIGAAILAYGQSDGANEHLNYADPTYSPMNAPMIVRLPGTTMASPNRWQPLALSLNISQNGIPIPNNVQVFVGPQWGSVTPFASDFASVLPGPPPLLHDPDTDDDFKAQAVEVIAYSSLLTPDDPTLIDISPASRGNNPLGTNDGTGYTLNPATGQPYVPQLVKRGDFGRVIAEFWADGPTSETPPGHWNALANYVADHSLFERRFEGAGPVLDPLEWDVKTYLALNGAEHDAAVVAWGTKRFYDSVRPISMIRYMGGLGQSSDPGGPSYHPDGLPLVPGLVEVITAVSSAPGERHEALAEHIGQIAVVSWPGEPADPSTQYSGVRWMRAVEWVAYQRKTFVTPPFAGYVSGHSTYSRSGAEVLTRLTGSPYFPGGLGEFVAPENAYLVFEVGPSGPVVLQWATYYDAADEAGQSRLWGGIHIVADDFEGRRLGAAIGEAAFEKALTYFDGSATP